ncbi:hypothetical protein [Parapedobacter sp. DT-150]|uniref:hypothetical protein n=1 Tax=Parapedobacter sp. DT-150 TaxID=3396162 RepID=UPI003F1C5D15
MNKQIKKFSVALLSLGFLVVASSCSKDDPEPEIPQEEIGSAKLTFTEVEWHGDHADDLENPEIVEVEFDGQGLPPLGTHLHLDAGKTYRLSLTAYDFAGREAQQEFVNDAAVHQVFLLGAPQGMLDYDYADPNDARVGVTGYLHVLAAGDGFVFNYILRHLNEGVKAGITADDWNNPDYTQFGGENDLDLKVEIHVVEEGHDDDH